MVFSLRILLCVSAAFFMVVAAPVFAASAELDFPDFADRPSYCLMFTVDGLDRDFVTSETMPNLYAWKNVGAELPDAINVYPTATTPNMSSLYTGAFPLRTGVGANMVFRKKEQQYVVGPRPRGVVSLNDAFKGAGHSTAGVQIYMMDKADRYVRAKGSSPHDVTTMTLSMVEDKTSVPTLMAVLFETVDKVSHRFGPDTAEARAEATKVDRGIGAIIARYADLGILQDTMVVITADHGMSATDHVVDQAAITRAVAGLGLKCEWLTRRGQKLSGGSDLYLLQGGNLQGYFNREFSAEEKQRLFSTLRGVEGVGTIFDAVALRRMNCSPSLGDFVAETSAGWRFRGRRGTHGTNRESDGYESFFGAGVKAGVMINNARTVDIMPTILEAFKIPVPETVDGRALRGALRK